ncbi:MAG: diversity-generating retroelement protein Avd [Blastocatellia bacterium]
MNKKENPELPVIQKTYDLILWYVPLLSKLPRDHKFTLGDRMTTALYDLLDELIEARYVTQKINLLHSSNRRLEKLRYQTRLLLDLKLTDGGQFQHASKLINGVGVNLGNWIKQQKT